jgi:WD40 repeat protein
VFKNHGRLAVAYSPNGTQIATCDATNTKFAVSVHDVATANVVHSLSGNENVATQVAFDPTSNFVAAGGRDRTVRVWDIATGKSIRTHFGESAINCIAWSPDGTRIVAAGEGGVIRVWSPSGPAIRTLTANQNVRSVTFSPDGRQLAVSCNLPAFVFDTFTGKKKATLEKIGPYAQFAWSPDGTRIGPTDKFGFWNAETGAVTEPTAPVLSGNFTVCEGAGTAFSPDGRIFATVTGTFSVHLWDTLDGRILYHCKVPTKNATGRGIWPVALAFHPDGKHLAIATGSDNWLRPGTLGILDVSSGLIISEFSGYLNCVFSVAYVSVHAPLRSRGGAGSVAVT